MLRILTQAIHARQYFHETLMMDAPAPEQSADRSMIVEQQLRWYARFILVCIMLGKKEVGWLMHTCRR